MTVYDIWASRSTSGYSGRGAVKATGFEHHVVSFARTPSVVADVAFKNFGVQRYRVEARGGAKPSSTYEQYDGLVIHGKVAAGAWSGTGVDGGVTTPFSMALEREPDVVVLPSFLARWLGLSVRWQEGELLRYLAVPEDGWPAWRPPRHQWFSVMNAHPVEVCSIVGLPVEVVKVGRTTVEAQRFDHVAADGNTVATLYVDAASRQPVKYEQMGCVLAVTSQAAATRLDPGGP